jgi:hypothetical protein
MKIKISISIAALLYSGVAATGLGDFQMAPIPFKTDLACTSCIRGGWNYCITIGGTVNGTIVGRGCEERDRNPNAKIDNTDPSGVAGGYVCSNALSDQMNSIVNFCMPA